jgi:4-hydroxybenzoyl-CoA reductase subunit gamma
MKRLLDLTLNGMAREDAVAENLLLLDCLRETVGLTGTKRGCDGGECGACTVLVDSRPHLACRILAIRCAGSAVETIEGLADNGRMARSRRLAKSRSAFTRENGRGDGQTPTSLRAPSERRRASTGM